MGFSVNLKFIVVIIGVAVAFFNYPPPSPSPLLTEWRQSGTFFTFKGYNIFYKDVKGSAADTGKQRTLLLLHGFPTSSFDWYKMLPELQKRFDRVIAPDFIGLGFSDKPTNFGYPITFQADIVEALIARLKVGDLDILAHDYGDTVAQELLARYNDNKLKFDIKTTTLLNGGIFPRKHIPVVGQKLLRLPYLKFIFSKIANFYFFRASLNQVFGTNKPTAEEIDDMWAQQRYLNGYQVMSELLTYIDQRFQNEDRWVGALVKYSTTKPIHLIAGPSDPINPILCQNFKKMVPLGSCDVLPDDISHYPNLEDPKGLLKFYFAFLDSELLTPSSSN
ncbi:hypothetical protein HA402_002116 [Bradysia odoriphaga]|nr:hypothetical protein HA402_002116 [Bradysia odoriphaga]